MRGRVEKVESDRISPLRFSISRSLSFFIYLRQMSDVLSRSIRISVPVPYALRSKASLSISLLVSPGRFLTTLRSWRHFVC